MLLLEDDTKNTPHVPEGSNNLNNKALIINISLSKENKKGHCLHTAHSILISISACLVIYELLVMMNYLDLIMDLLKHTVPVQLKCVI